VNYNKEAQIKKIKEFLEDTLNQEDIPIIQEMFGDCLLREYRYKKALMCVGETDTGKSQLLSLLWKFIGQNNISSKPLDLLCHDKFSTYDLYGKLANIRAELGIIPLRSIDKFLMLTGGDIIGAERKYQQSFNFRNYAKLIFSCNQVPESENKNLAYYNRWLAIEFTNQVPKEEQIPNIFNTISTEEELSGLLNWSIEGIKRLMEKNHYSDHRNVIDIKTFMERGVNPILDFINTYIERDAEGEISKDTLYNCYLEFCKSLGYPTKDSNVFSRKFKPLAPLGIEEGETRIGNHKKVWRGIKCTWVLGVQQEKLIC
jgi:putative DNA primase/helicase